MRDCGSGVPGRQQDRTSRSTRLRDVGGERLGELCGLKAKTRRPTACAVEAVTAPFRHGPTLASAPRTTLPRRRLPSRRRASAGPSEIATASRPGTEARVRELGVLASWTTAKVDEPTQPVPHRRRATNVDLAALDPMQASSSRKAVIAANACSSAFGGRGPKSLDDGGLWRRRRREDLDPRAGSWRKR